MNVKEIVYGHKFFDLSTMDIDKFKDVIRITSYIVQDTGLRMSGIRHDGGVIGFGNIDNDYVDYVSYNLDNDVLFLNYDVLTGTQVRSLHGIASMFGLTIEEFDDA